MQRLKNPDRLLVAYGDGLVTYGEADGSLTRVEQRRFPCQACCVLQSAIITAGEGTLRLFDGELKLLCEQSSNCPEEIVDLVDGGGGRFLAVSETQEVFSWQLDGNQLELTGKWMVECTPLFSKGPNKPVLCEERGRLQERDVKTGTVLKTWSGLSNIVWGTVDREDGQALVIDQNGTGTVLDLLGGEPLFVLDCPFPLRSGCFAPGGLGGAVLGTEGEAATFRVTQGGETTLLETPESPLVAICYHQGALHGLDDNGGLWSLVEELEFMGGEWAGWATTGLRLESGQILLGTAGGTVEAFAESGERCRPSVQLHHDAVLALEKWGPGVVSVGADASVCHLTTEAGAWQRKTLATYPGRSVVDSALCAESGRMWLALDEGLLAWFKLEKPEERDEIELPGRRIEELRTAGPGSVIILTDRGSVRRFSAP